MRLITLLLLFLLPVLMMGKSFPIMLKIVPKKCELSETTIAIFRMGVEEILTGKGYSLVDLDAQNEVISEQQKQQKTGCYDDSCLVSTGKMLAAQGLFLVEVIKAKKVHAFKLRYIDLESATTLSSKSMLYTGDIEDATVLLPFSKKLAIDGFKHLRPMAPQHKTNKKKSVVAVSDSVKMVLVPGGSFKMGCDSKKDSACQQDEIPQHRVALKPFKIDEHEVTVAQYEACFKSGKCSSKDFNNVHDNRYCNYDSKRSKKHPMNCVSWYGADTYCKWVGKKLPTEAQWEKAARGIDGRINPWGNEGVTCDYAQVPNQAGDGCGKQGTVPVKQFKKGISPYGAYDMIGNAPEWVRDWYHATVYRKRDGVKDPVGPEFGNYRVVRGGSWYRNQAIRLRGTFRNRKNPSKRGYVGFRCVVELEKE